MAKPVITDKPVLDQAEFNGVTIWQKEGGSIEVSDTNYPSMKAAIKDIAARAGVTLQDDWNTQYSGRYLIQQLKMNTSKKTSGLEMVDLGLSVKWASCNLGASRPEEHGRYFAWGDVKGQTWNGSEWSGGKFAKFPEYEVDNNNNLKPEFDAAHVILGDSYRMPTKDECQELIDNCESAWTDDYQGTGVAGRVFTSKKNGNAIFLPAAGFGDDGLCAAGSCGRYWSSTFDHYILAKILQFLSDDVVTSNNFRNLGWPIRSVSESK